MRVVRRRNCLFAQPESNLNLELIRQYRHITSGPSICPRVNLMRGKGATRGGSIAAVVDGQIQ